MQREQSDHGSAGHLGTSQHSAFRSKVFERYQDPTKQFTGTRSYHQDHSSVGGLTAKDINKAREAKRSISKPHKQMVRWIKWVSSSRRVLGLKQSFYVLSRVKK